MGEPTAADLLGDLIDALADDLRYEVYNSPHVAEVVGRACRLLGGPYAGYLEDPCFAAEGAL